MKRRLKALKKLQLESTKIEAKFYQEIHDLEIKYHEMYKPIYKKRSQINKGNERRSSKKSISSVMSARKAQILTPLMILK